MEAGPLAADKTSACQDGAFAHGAPPRRLRLPRRPRRCRAAQRRELGEYRACRGEIPPEPHRPHEFPKASAANRQQRLESRREIYSTAKASAATRPQRLESKREISTRQAPRPSRRSRAASSPARGAKAKTAVSRVAKRRRTLHGHGGMVRCCDASAPQAIPTGSGAAPGPLWSTVSSPAAAEAGPRRG